MKSGGEKRGALNAASHPFGLEQPHPIVSTFSVGLKNHGHGEFLVQKLVDQRHESEKLIEISWTRLIQSTAAGLVAREAPGARFVADPLTAFKPSIPHGIARFSKPGSNGFRHRAKGLTVMADKPS